MYLARMGTRLLVGPAAFVVQPADREHLGKGPGVEIPASLEETAHTARLELPTIHPLSESRMLRRFLPEARMETLSSCRWLAVLAVAEQQTIL